MILGDAVEGEVFVVDGVQSAAQDSSLDFVLLVRQQLQFDVRITRSCVRVTHRQADALDHRYVQRALVQIVPSVSITTIKTAILNKNDAKSDELATMKSGDSLKRSDPFVVEKKERKRCQTNEFLT